MTSIRTSLKLVLAIGGLGLGAVACGESASSTTLQTIPISEFTTTTVGPAEGEQPADYEGFRAQTTACGAEQPPPLEAQQHDAPEDQKLDPTQTVIAVIETSCGNIVIELDPAEAPETVNSFVFLADKGYFDGSVSHRIAPEFVVQAGDPEASGFGGPGYVIADEPPQGNFRYQRGVVAMANAGPGTTGSQFFIMIEDRDLPPQFNVLGRVIEGLDVVDTIANLPIGFNEGGEPSLPLETLYLNSITIG